MSKLVREYFDYQQSFQKKYGQNTIVLMQVGSFYEFYGLDTDKLSYKEVDANYNLDNTHLYTVSKLLGFSIAKKTNNILMAGVPKYAIDKHVKKLLDNNYTIVVIEQIGDDNYVNTVQTSGDLNFATVAQWGDDNYALTRQLGDSNGAAVTQLGLSHSSTIMQTGAFNAADVFQTDF